MISSPDEIVYAKSKPPLTLKQHTDSLISNLEVLRKEYGNPIEAVLPKEYRSLLWGLLEISVLHHDLGKISSFFQYEIRKAIGENALPPRNGSGIPHNMLSPAFLSQSLVERYDEEVRKVLVQAIFYHHERSLVPNFTEIEREIVEDLFIRKHLTSDIIRVPDDLWKGYARYARIRITEKDKSYPLYILVKGLIHRIDHSASASVPIEIRDNTLHQRVSRFLSKKGGLRPLQEYVNNHRNENIVTIASTGSGKTEAALLWSGNDKAFFTLPLRVAVNTIYDRIADEHLGIGYGNTGLLHSSSLDYLDYKGYETPIEIHRNSRQLAYQYNISTIDQLFTFPFKYGGYEKILSTLLYSKVIIDEIQSYEPRLAAIILRGLKEINKLGGRFLIMTATLPQIYLDTLRKWGIEFQYGQFLTELKRHKIVAIEGPITSGIKEIKELSTSKKVLIIVNTVRRANELCDALIQRGVNPFLLHSMFIKEDRDALESEIKLFSVKEDSGVWITTQLAEASLDIDFDVLFTELSALDSLLQRMGRVFRQREYTAREPNIYIYTDDCSGIGTIYDEDIFQLSKKEIVKYHAILLTEQEKTDCVSKVYGYDAVKNTDYYKEFKNALGVLDNVSSYELSKKEVQRILRDIYSVKVIPVDVWKTFEQDLNAKIQIVSEPKLHDRKGLLEADRFINNKTIDVPIFRLKKLNHLLSPLKEIQGVFLIHCRYDRQKGLLLFEQGSNLIL